MSTFKPHPGLCRRSVYDHDGVHVARCSITTPATHHFPASCRSKCSRWKWDPVRRPIRSAATVPRGTTERARGEWTTRRNGERRMDATKPRLGRGLSALLERPASVTATALRSRQTANVIAGRTDRHNPYQPRKAVRRGRDRPLVRKHPQSRRAATAGGSAGRASNSS